MGTPVPPEPWEIDPDKNYLVTVDTWFAPVPPAECGQFHQGKFQDTFIGQVIIDWIEAGKECTYDILIGPPLALLTNRIYTIEEV